ncbi:hypothetical protein [Burkholderia sp. AU31652]|uniref:hypothetical protein n=1 Tax=Burkholderia sp. AU31652 TaxID=2015354 RepID=UPI0015C6193C|nr:hypothetical protein [Burkholderia sp. AU31652]
MPNASHKDITHHKNSIPNYITMLNRFARIFTDCDRPFGLFAVLALIAISNGGVL